MSEAQETRQFDIQDLPQEQEDVFELMLSAEQVFSEETNTLKEYMKLSKEYRDTDTEFMEITHELEQEFTQISELHRNLSETQSQVNTDVLALYEDITNAGENPDEVAKELEDPSQPIIRKGIQIIEQSIQLWKEYQVALTHYNEGLAKQRALLSQREVLHRGVTEAEADFQIVEARAEQIRNATAQALRNDEDGLYSTYSILKDSLDEDQRKGFGLLYQEASRSLDQGDIATAAILTRQAEHFLQKSMEENDAHQVEMARKSATMVAKDQEDHAKPLDIDFQKLHETSDPDLMQALNRRTVIRNPLKDPDVAEIPRSDGSFADAVLEKVKTDEERGKADDALADEFFQSKPGNVADALERENRGLSTSDISSLPKRDIELSRPTQRKKGFFSKLFRRN